MKYPDDIKKLKNAPLAEAIFEIRWSLLMNPTGTIIDPHYQLLVGRIYDRLKLQYPFHEPLQAASLPDDVAPYVVRHRFRTAEDEWPLVQIGPGIATLNDTEKYQWVDFQNRITGLIEALIESYPSGLKLSLLMLRYIDAVEFDFRERDVFKFMQKKLKMNVNIDDVLFEKPKLNRLPERWDISFSFKPTVLKGEVGLRFRRGKKKDKEALVWDTVVKLDREGVPQKKEGVVEWANKAHELTHTLFFTMIEGELYEEFK